MPFSRFRNRASEPEIMDDFGLEGQTIDMAVDDISWVNQWLGGNGISLGALKNWLADHPECRNQPLKLVDLGCANGDTLRQLARWARKEGIPMSFTGLDANPYLIRLATEQSADFPEITFRTANILDPGCSFEGADLAHCGLFLHHFEEQDILNLFRRIRQQQVAGLLINDLQRSAGAYYLFAVLSRIIRLSPMAREDGLLSVRKAFSRQELTGFLTEAGLSNIRIRWRWAFRYQISADC